MASMPEPGSVVVESSFGRIWHPSRSSVGLCVRLSMRLITFLWGLHVEGRRPAVRRYFCSVGSETLGISNKFHVVAEMPASARFASTRTANHMYGPATFRNQAMANGAVNRRCDGV